MLEFLHMRFRGDFFKSEVSLRQSLPFLTTNHCSHRAKSYSEEESRGWLQESGWRAVERKPLAGPVSLLVAETTS